jgi:O-antigen/teichoic acid export membrane protein
MKISHVAWNLAGLSIPLLIAAISIPSLLAIIGNERFGLLALTWGLIGYAGILDFGIGRALTKVVASMLGNDDQESIPGALKTATQVTLWVSLIGACFICVMAVVGATHFLKVETIPDSELIFGAILFAMALPLQAISATYKGVSEAYLNFRALSVIRVVLGASTFGLPLIIAQFTQSMPALIGSLLLSRLLALTLYQRVTHKCISHIQHPNPKTSKLIRKKLLHFGGWFSISNILNPVLGSLDRIFIGTLVSSAAIAAYAIPYEVTAQSLVIIGAITTVTFPYLAALLSKDQAKANQFFIKILGGSAGFMLIVTFFLYFSGPTVLQIWLAEKMDPQSGAVIKTLSLGLVPYTIGTLCTSLIHSYGRTDITAKIHLVEFPFFCALIFYMIDSHGLVGAALAWVMRVSLDAILLCIATLVLANRPIELKLES